MNAINAVRLIMKRERARGTELSLSMGKSRGYIGSVLYQNADIKAGTLANIARALGYELVLKRGPECVTIDE